MHRSPLAQGRAEAAQLVGGGDAGDQRDRRQIERHGLLEDLGGLGAEARHQANAVFQLRQCLRRRSAAGISTAPVR